MSAERRASCLNGNPCRSVGIKITFVPLWDMSSHCLKRVSFQRWEDSNTSHHCCIPLCAASEWFNSDLSLQPFFQRQKTAEEVCNLSDETTLPLLIHRDLQQTLFEYRLDQFSNFSRIYGFVKWACLKKFGKAKPNTDSNQSKDAPVDADDQNHNYSPQATLKLNVFTQSNERYGYPASMKYPPALMWLRSCQKD